MNRLCELRKEKNLKQIEIAKMINMSQNGYSQYETETIDIPTDILIKLADIYETNIDYILNLTDIKTPYTKTILTENIGTINRLREIREDKDLTQKDIAKILGISNRGYGMYEDKTNDISTKYLIKLAIFYNVSIDYILYFTDERVPYPRKK